MECRFMWEKSNLKQFNIRQQHNKNVKKIKGYEYFRKALYIYTQSSHYLLFMSVLYRSHLSFFVINIFFFTHNTASKI